MRLQIAAFCQLGDVRTTNEDVVMIDGIRVPEQGVKELCLSGRTDHLLLVADGMGGHVAGDIASGLAVQHVADHWRRDRSRFNLTSAIRSANQSLFDAMAGELGLRGMGSTIAAVHICDGRLHWSNVGDSRVYLFRDEELRQLTVDHAAGDDDIHPVGVLTQCLGGSSIFIEVEPGQGTEEVYPGDTVLMCSDGVSGVIGEREIVRACRAADPCDVSLRLYSSVRDHGAPDNLAQIVVRFS